jgi:hypothetical protein
MGHGDIIYVGGRDTGMDLFHLSASGCQTDIFSPLDIDGRPSLSSFQSVVAREEIAAIDPDFVETEASVPDGMR